MNKVCLCVGVGNYEVGILREKPLPGTITDAERMFAALTNPKIGECDPATSRKLIDPSLADVRSALGDLIYDGGVDTLNLFFACHGGVQNSGYFLTCRDTNAERLALTGLSFSDLFQMLNDGCINHTNIIIDACHAGGMASDLPNLFRAQSQGLAGALSVSILTLSARDEFAGEYREGGVGSTAVLGFMNGSQDAGSNKSHLSLDDIGKCLELEHAEQSARVWSFNISGTSKFCRNVFAAENRSEKVFPVPSIQPEAVGELSEQSLEQLLEAYKSLPSLLDCRKLQNASEAALSELSNSSNQASFLLGMCDSTVLRVSDHDDAFAKVYVISTFLFLSQQIRCESERGIVQSFFWSRLGEELDISLTFVLDQLGEHEYFLVYGGGGFSEFFSLPIRITRLAAWALFYLEISGDDMSAFPACREKVEKILAHIEEKYASAFDLVSEEQAPDLLLVSSLAKRHGFSDWAKRFVGSFYSNYFFFEGRVAKSRLPPEDVYDFMKFRCGSTEIDSKRFKAKPSELLFVLLLHYFSYDDMETIRYDFVDLDGEHVGTYVPDTYSDFTAEVISHGRNLGFHVGFDVFTLGEFESFVYDHLKGAITSGARDCTKLDLYISVMASLIYPDRMPWHIVGRLTEEVH